MPKQKASGRIQSATNARTVRWNGPSAEESLSIDSSSTSITRADPTDSIPSSSSSSHVGCIIGIPITPRPCPPTLPTTTSTFEKKIKQSSCVVTNTNGDNNGDGDIPIRNERTIVDLTHLCDFMSQFICPECKIGTVSVTIIEKSSRGFAKHLSAYCSVCDENVRSSFTSKQESDRAAFSVNTDIVSASLQSDFGPYKLNRLCEYLNMPSLHQKTFLKHASKLKQQVNVESADMFEKAAGVIRTAHDMQQGTLDIAVSFDGTWLTRGYSSLIGIGSVIEVSTGVVLDMHIISLHCQVCATTGAWQRANNPTTFDTWLAEHEKDGCSKNFHGVSGMMEPEAASVLWSRSLERYDMRYTTMVGDGDSKAFDCVTKLQPYGDIVIEKEECMNHVSKRLGTALRNIVQDCAKKGITLGGRKSGSLTGDKIKKLCVYYARAIRANDDPEEMRQSILASLFHCYSTDDLPQHQYCPVGEKSWCFYKRDLAHKAYPGGHAKRIHTFLDYGRLHPHIWPIYQRLTDLDLLKRCRLHATQNCNESLHHSIWARCAKSQFHDKSTVEFAALCAVSEFNFGPNEAILKQSGLQSERLRAARQQKRLCHRKRQSQAKEASAGHPEGRGRVLR